MCMECVHAGIAAGAAGLTVWKSLPVLLQKLKDRKEKKEVKNAESTSSR